MAIATALALLFGCGPATVEPDAGADGARPELPDAGARDALVRRLTTSADPAAPLQNVTQWNWSHALDADDADGIHAVWVALGSSSVEYAADLPDPVDVAALPTGEIRYGRSTSRGETWDAERALTDRAAGTDSANVAVSSGHVYAVWRAADAGQLRVFFRASADGGSTWGDAVAISDAPVGVSVSPPSLAVSRSTETPSVYVVWSDARPRTVGATTFSVKEVYLASSDDRGATWNAVRPVSLADGRSSWTPSVAAAGDLVHVAWTDERDDVGECTRDANPCREEEYYRRSTDGGVLWEDEQRLTTDPASSWAPSIAAWGSSVHVAYLDGRTGAFRNYYRRSTDGGARFEDEVLLGSDPRFANAARPTLAVRDATVHVAWFGFTDFEADVYHAWSPDDGLTWSGALDLTEDGVGAARLPHVAVDTSGAPHMIWYDTRHSDASGPRVEIYYARPWG